MKVSDWVNVPFLPISKRLKRILENGSYFRPKQTIRIYLRDLDVFDLSEENFRKVVGVGESTIKEFKSIFHKRNGKKLI